MSDYEQLRLENMARNRDMLRSLGLDGGTLLGSDAAAESADRRRRATVAASANSEASNANDDPRRSSRLSTRPRADLREDQDIGEEDRALAGEHDQDYEAGHDSGSDVCDAGADDDASAEEDGEERVVERKRARRTEQDPSRAALAAAGRARRKEPVPQAPAPAPPQAQRFMPWDEPEPTKARAVCLGRGDNVPCGKKANYGTKGIKYFCSSCRAEHHQRIGRPAATGVRAPRQGKRTCACGHAANYGPRGGPRLSCGTCAQPGYVNLLLPYCADCDAMAIFGPPESKAVHCKDHKADGDVVLAARRCLVCGATASWGPRDATKKPPMRCRKHALDGDVPVYATKKDKST
eukprot:TRINITY_DN515_c3_g1_i1.p2 TRINITY_DN515_c3_g1~~TRINITY_DN515_c3_g1_i1.p2  ORF type:complete len:350 (-),score=92.69 TRINITY_DN515_c3_g1_i1:312-1361(-)